MPIQQHRTLQTIGGYMQFNESTMHIREDFSTLWKGSTLSFKKGWHSMRQVSSWLGYSIKLVQLSEQNYGTFLWAPEFANVHGTFPYEEKGFEVDGIWFPHSEGYFQAMKAYGTSDWERVLAEIQEADPLDSWSIGQRCKLRPDWEEVKDEIMMTAIRNKFKDPYLKDLLLSTDGYPLVQLKYCSYWGSGPDGKGKNALGVLLEKLREEIKNS